MIGVNRATEDFIHRAPVSYGDVGDVVEEMQNQHGDEVPALPGTIDDIGFRERLRLVVLFRLVKQQVVGSVDTPLETLEAEYAADPRLHGLEFAEASGVIRERLAAAEADWRWVGWLAAKRACGNVRILDTAVGLPSSTPAPGCSDATR
jgi:hypothetical protein